jgi:acyl transferase domain-containing protein/NAD(P)-dependent dehydrogenase (short-subunit alcohol dehydrogenase family)
MIEKLKLQTQQGAAQAGSIAIIGISCMFPGAEDADAYWSNIKNGVDGISDIPEGTHWSAKDYFDSDPKAPDMTYAKRGGFISPVDFDPLEFGIAPKDIEATDTTQILGLVAAKRALVDAGYAGEGAREYDRDRTSVILGVTGTLELVIPLGARLGHPIWRKALKDSGVDPETAEDVVERISDSYVPWQENSFPGLLGNVVAGRIANRLDLGGTNCVVDAACASSLSAIHLARLELEAGRSDMVIAGGLDTFNDIFMYMCFSKTPALSKSGDAKPFSADADGTILGEGIGIVALKRLEDAERDNDKIYAVIRGLGSSSDGAGDAVYAPQSGGQKKALKRAYEQACVTPDSIELVEAHGTGTTVGDSAEVTALADVYGGAKESGPWCALGSVKSQIGHTKAAAGAAGIIKAALALHNKVLPPTIKVDQPVEAVAPGKTPFYVNAEKRPWLASDDHPRRAGVSSFGFGGSNFHCLLEEHGAGLAQAPGDGAVQLLTFSGDRIEDLRSALSEQKTDLPWRELRAIAAASRKSFDGGQEFRLALIVEKDRSDLTKLVAHCQSMLAKDSTETHWELPEGAVFGRGKPTGDLGVLFPGQGSQYPNMLRDLACESPEMREVLEQSNRIFSEERETSRKLSDYIYPHAAFDEDTADRQRDELTATDVAQPAIGAVSLGSLKTLESYGLAPSAAAGHSYGELVALCASGVFESSTLHRLSNLRGRLMANANGDGETESGAMLAVKASGEQVESFIREAKLELVVANRNAPDQSVLAGKSEEIDRAAGLFEKESIWNRKLPVAAAFHSPLVAAAQKPFEQALGKVKFSRSNIPVYANTTAQSYPRTAARARKLLGGQLAQPVDFVSEIKAMRESGVSTFLEVGPGRTLTGLVKSILSDDGVRAIALDNSRGKRSGAWDLANVLSNLAVLGYEIDLKRWDENAPKLPTVIVGKKPRLTISVCGANQMNVRPSKAPRPMKELAATTAHVANPDTPQTPVVPRPTPTVQSAISSFPASPTGLSQALQDTRQSMSALALLQEQTARLHKQFLEGQEAAQRTLHSLIEQQNGLFNNGGAVSQTPVSVSTPVVASQPAPSVPAPAPVPSSEPVADSNPAGNSISQDRISAALLDVVAEKTGYPTEMLNLEMGLDSDLGIDSIKRVEIMSALQEKLPGAPEIKPSHLGSLQTLQEVVDFLSGGSNEASGEVAQESSVSAASVGGVSSDAVALALLEVVAEKTGYPVDMLSLEMGLDSDLGIDSIKRVEIMSALQERLPEAPEVKPSGLGSLETLQQVVDFLSVEGSVPSAEETVDVVVASDSGLDAVRVASALLEVVAEKTGYPVDMLGLGMGLDTDLGIDSIKRVEIMSALQTALPEAPEVKPNQLGSLQTLQEVVDFLCGEAASSAELSTSPVKAPELAGEAAVSPEAKRETPAIEQYLQRQVLTSVELNGHAKQEAVSLKAGATIWIADDGSELAKQLAKQLKQAGFKPRRARIKTLLDGEPPASLDGLVIVGPAQETDGLFLREAFRLIQFTGPGLRHAGQAGGAALVTVSRLDGAFGLAELNGNGNPVTGGLAGLSKTARHEWSEVHCKALDIDAEANDPAGAAAAVAQEMFRGGPIEVGLAGKTRYAIELQTVPIDNLTPRKPLAPGDVVVVSGGSRGVTAATAIAIAKEFQPTLVLLGRSAAPETEPEWLRPLSQESDIKKAIYGRLNAGGNLKDVEREYRRWMANREMTRNMGQMEAAGAKVVYRSVDVRDAKAVSEIVDDVRATYGPIGGVVHGAGVLADRRIEDKTAEQFELVYSTKVNGLQALLSATANDELKIVALFSSFTGRYGRVGQIDYAAANEVLNKLAQSEARKRPTCRVVSVNWGPWNGGMVDSSLRRIFEAEGVGLIEPRAGADYLVKELSTPAGERQPVEVVVMAPFGKRVEAVSGSTSEAAKTEPSGDSEGIAFERTVSVDELPCLTSHVIGGKAVMPLALSTEWLAHGAMHGHPGMAFQGIDKLKVFKGVMLDSCSTLDLQVTTAPARSEAEALIVPTQLISWQDGRKVIHAGGDIVLGAKAPTSEAARLNPDLPEGIRGQAAIYGGDLLFHGPDFQGILQLQGNGESGIAASVAAAPAPKDWIKRPLRGTWITDPLAIDCAYQMMILWSWGQNDKPSLPTGVGSYRQFKRTFPKDGVRIVASIKKASRRQAVADIEFLDSKGGLIARMEDYRCIIDGSLKAAFEGNQIVG